ncbi:MAG TPA: hypothetical protein VGU20_13920 [Stellaceae bacterium]|nr:hypothetical protein [Stellaceae bacterium]
MHDMGRSSCQMFRYRWAAVARGDSGICVLLAIFTTIGVLGAISGPNLAGLAVGFGADAFFIFLYLNYRSKFASIRISQDGVTAFLFGLRWKTIEWTEVTKFRRFRYADWDSQKSQKYRVDYCIHRQRKHFVFLERIFLDVIIFNEQIQELPRLLQILNDTARRYHIPLVAVDREQDFKNASQGNGLKKLLPEFVEQPIQAL